MNRVRHLLFFTVFLFPILLFSSCGESTPAEKKSGTLEHTAVSYPTNIERILLDDELPEETDNRFLLVELARNEYEGCQFVLQSEEEVAVRVSVSDLTGGSGVISKEHIRLYRQHYMDTRGSYLGRQNSYYHPDPLIPLNDEDLTTLPANKNQGFTITLHASEDTPAGRYTGTVTVAADGGSIEIPLHAEVWDFTLPHSPSTTTAFSDFELSIAKYYGLTDEAAMKLVEDFYWFMIDYRITPMNLPARHFAKTPEELVEMSESLIRDERVSCYRIPFYDNEELDNRLCSLLRERGLLEKGYFYGIDEPQPGEYEKFRQRRAAMHAAAPEVPVMVPTVGVMPVELDEVIDIWCPRFDSYNPALAAALQEEGDTVWWYGCTSPVYPFPTYHIHDRLLSARMLSWMQKGYGVEGNLYWSATYYTKYGDEGSKLDAFNDPYAYTAPGEGLLIYPGQEGDGLINENRPIPSMRLEAIRDGAEDYEYLVLLQNVLTEHIDALGIGAFVTSDDIMEYIFAQLYTAINDFDNDPGRLLAMRRQIAEQIMTLSDSPTLVHIRTPETSEAYAKREVTVYAPAGAEVRVNGLPAAAGEPAGGAFRYDITAELEDGLQQLEVTVKTEGRTHTQQYLIVAAENMIKTAYSPF